MFFISPTQFDAMTLGDEACAYFPTEGNIRAIVGGIETEVGRLTRSGKDYAEAFGSVFTRARALVEMVGGAKQRRDHLGQQVNAFYIALHRLTNNEEGISPHQRMALMDALDDFCVSAEMSGFKLPSEVSVFMDVNRREAKSGPRQPYVRPNPKGVEW
jgi:hypothetical protein